MWIPSVPTELTNERAQAPGQDGGIGRAAGLLIIDSNACTAPPLIEIGWFEVQVWPRCATTCVFLPVTLFQETANTGTGRGVRDNT